MRISPDKLNKLAHTVADTLAEIDEVGFLEDRNTIRQEARKALTTLLTQEAGIDTAARLKIANQRKIIMEGSQEWEILYRKYYKRRGSEAGHLSRLRRGLESSLASTRVFVNVEEWP
jgi:hypothetical protein